MEFEVLGPLRVRDGERPAPLTAAMPRSLLGVLLTRVNAPVPVDVLVDALWGSRQAGSTHKKLQLHVHRLRRALGDPGRIRYEYGGYMLRVRPGELDAERFERLLDEGADTAEPTAAVPPLRAALALWRGDPFGDLADLPLLRVEADRLAERRLAGLEELYTAELACGHGAAVVPEVAELAARHPLRERLQGLLMSALYQAGRQADALEAYRRTRAALVDELGLEPGSELQALHAAILTGDASLRGAAPSPSAAGARPAQLPADLTDFVGRDTQLAAARAHLAARADRPAVLAVAGTAGVGKTSLAVHAAHQLRDRFADGQLYVDLRGAEGRPLEAAEVLARFLRGLGVGRAAVPEDPEERAASYRSRLAGRRVLVLLDNAASETQVRPLLPGDPGCGVLVTSRARLGGLDGARLVDLDVLEPARAVELLARLVGPSRVDAEPDAAERIVRLCGYLPLAVRVAGARLTARPHRPLARLAADLADERHRLDELRVGDLEVRASLALSYDSLDVTARRAFRRLGLLDAPDVAAWVVAALLDVGQDRAEDLVDVLVDAQLLDVAGRDAAGQLRYRYHDLMRACAREVATIEEPAVDRLAALERAVGGWLNLAERAGQHMASASFGVDLDPASCWEPDAGVTAAATADPSAWFEAEWSALSGAIEQACATGLDRLTADLALRLAPICVARSSRGYYDDWRRISELLRTAGRRSGNRRWEATALRGLGEVDVLQYRLDDAVTHFEQAHVAFAEAGDVHGQTLATSGIGAAYTEAGRFAEALPRLEQAIAALRELGDRRSEAWTLRRLGTLYRLQGGFERAADCFEQALEAFEQLGDPIGESGVLERLGVVRTLQGRGREARDLLERSRELRGRHDDHYGEARALAGLGELHRIEGRWREAMTCLGDSLRRWRELGLPWEQARTLAHLGVVHEQAGNAEAADTARREARHLLAEVGVPDTEEPRLLGP